MALGLEMKNYVPVLGGASIVVALQLWWRFNCGGAVITANTVHHFLMERGMRQKSRRRNSGEDVKIMI